MSIPHFAFDGCIFCGKKDVQTFDCDCPNGQEYKKELTPVVVYKGRCIVCLEEHDYEDCPDYAKCESVFKHYYDSKHFVKIIEIGNFRLDSLPSIRYVTVKRDGKKVVEKWTIIKIYFCCKSLGFPSEQDEIDICREMHENVEIFSRQF